VKSQDLKKLNLPDKPGVYFFVRNPSPSRRGSTTKSRGEVLYIGKATNLRDRVRSYFAKDLIDTRGPGILDMTLLAGTVEFQETDSVLEALILEANLIKKHQPKYNVKEKDNKSFNCIAITNDPLPKVIIIRERETIRQPADKKFNAVFGPYPNGSLLRDALKIIRKIFPFVDDNSAKKDQKEFYKQLGLTPSQESEYSKNIRNIKLFLSGKKSKVIASLEKEMKSHAKKHEFELAEIAKRKIFALNHINDVALIKDESLSSLEERVDGAAGRVRIESYDIAHLSGKNTVGVMTVVTNGRVDKAEYRKFIIRSGKGNDDYGNLKEVLTRRLNHPEWGMPNLIVIDGGLGQYNAACEIVQGIDLVSVIKDEKHKPKGIHGNPELIRKYKKDILLANNESHRFAVTFHKQKRSKDFLG
jgi:excinuclease ABC subunit C